MEDLASNCLIDDEDEKTVDISKEIKYSNNVLFQKWIRWCGEKGDHFWLGKVL